MEPVQQLNENFKEYNSFEIELDKNKPIENLLFHIGTRKEK